MKAKTSASLESSDLLCYECQEEKVLLCTWIALRFSSSFLKIY